MPVPQTPGQTVSPTVTPTGTAPPAEHVADPGATGEVTPPTKDELDQGAADETLAMLGGDDDAGDDDDGFGPADGEAAGAGEGEAGDGAADDGGADDAAKDGGGDADAAAGADESAKPGDEGADKGEAEAAPTEKPAAEAAAKPEQTPEQVEQERQRVVAQQARFDEFSTSYAQLQQAVAKNEFDPYDPTLAKVTIEGMALLAEQLHDVQQFVQQQRQTHAAGDAWTRWGADHPEIGAETGREIFTREFKAAREEFPDQGKAVWEAMANRELARNVKLRKGQKDAAAAKEKEAAPGAPAKPAGRPMPAAPAKTFTPAPRVTKGGASITPPPQGGTRVPRKTAVTVEDKLNTGQFGDLSRESY